MAPGPLPSGSLGPDETLSSPTSSKWLKARALVSRYVKPDEYHEPSSATRKLSMPDT